MISDSNFSQVTVVVHTYNQEKYIGDCLDGILKQDFDSGIDILVIDDCSTDRTVEICRLYQEKFPKKLTIVCLDKNEFGLGNLVGFDSYFSITSKYIAWCDGDDYWIDEKKISKQIKTMEDDTEISITHTDYQVLDERGSISNLFSRSDRDRLKAKHMISGKDLINGNHIKHSTALILRSAIDFDFVGASRGIYAGDWLTCISAARSKSIFFMDEKTSIVRITKQGMWNGEVTTRHQEQKSRVRWYCATHLPDSELRELFRKRVLFDWVRNRIATTRAYGVVRPFIWAIRNLKSKVKEFL